MKIGSDVDDVLTPWYYPSHEYAVKAGVNYNNVKTPTVWAAHEEYGCSLEEWLEAVYAMTPGGYYREIEPYPGAVAALKRIHNAGHEIHLITSRGAFKYGDQIKADTEEWVRRWFPFVESLTFSSDKTKPRTEYFLDDLPKNVDKVLSAGIRGVLHNQPWNRGISGYDRVRSVKGFADLVLGEDRGSIRKEASRLLSV